MAGNWRIIFLFRFGTLESLNAVSSLGLAISKAVLIDDDLNGAERLNGLNGLNALFRLRPRTFDALNLERSKQRLDHLERLERFERPLSCFELGNFEPRPCFALRASESDTGICTKMFAAITCDYEADQRLFRPLRQAH